MLLTVPVVDPDKDDRNWKRPLNCLQLVISPLVLVLTLQSGVCKYSSRSPTVSVLLPFLLIFFILLPQNFIRPGYAHPRFFLSVAQWLSGSVLLPAGGARDRRPRGQVQPSGRQRLEEGCWMNEVRENTCLAAEGLGFMSTSTKKNIYRIRLRVVESSFDQPQHSRSRSR